MRLRLTNRPMMPKTPAFALKQLATKVRGFLIKADIAWQNPSLIGLIGASGAGKSSLFNVISGMAKCDNGQIILNGLDITEYPIAKRQCDYLFQHDNLFPHYSLLENYRLGTPAITKEQAIHALDIVGLTGFEHRKPFELSGGQLKRAGLGRIITRQRKLWLLDEPLSGLEPKLRRELMADISNFQKKYQISVIISSHEPELLHGCDFLAFMDAGEVACFGAPEFVLSSSKLKNYN